MNDPLRAKSSPPAGRDRTPAPPPTGPYIRCQDCGYRAYLDTPWRPSFGIEPLLRRFTCKDGHHTYRAFTKTDLDSLA